MVRKTERQQRQIEGFSAYLGKLNEAVRKYQNQPAARRVEEFRRQFAEKVNDFFRENRKLEVAVIGQVKAGKSSFLNTLLFDGKPVLPSACTPKTSVLTRIEYGEQNRLLVDYLSAEEWENLNKLANSQLATAQARAARDTVDLAKAVHTPLERCFALRQETLDMEQSAELSKRLNDYIGEDGIYTPAVKNLTLQVKAEGLKGISVVDTPGLNDPLYSRTEKTRRYLETCDVAFLLSRSSCFLDASDLRLLALQLPHKGIKSLVLVGSQFDSVLIDVLPDFNSLEEAIDASVAELCAHARLAVEQSVRALRREGYPPVVLEVIEHCEKPVFVSALVEGMLGKSAQKYTEQEALVLRQLGYHGAPTEEQLRRIANFGEMRDLFDRLTLQKDALMQQKAEALVVFAQSELKLLLSEISRQVEQEIASLQSRQSAAKQRMDEVAAQINRIQSEVDGVFEEYLSPLDEALSHIQLELRDLQRDWAEPEYQESYEIRTHAQTVSAAKLFLPWTWGKKRTEYQNETIAYTYLDADQVGQNLRLLNELAANLQEGAFSQFADTSRLAAGLYSAAQRCCSLEGFGGTSEKLGQAITAAVGRLPGFRPSAARNERELLPLNVEGQVRDPALQQKLYEASFAAAARILEDSLSAANRYAALLRAAAQTAANEVKSVLCESLVTEQNRLLEEQAYVQESLASLQEFREIIYRYM